MAIQPTNQSANSQVITEDDVEAFVKDPIGTLFKKPNFIELYGRQNLARDHSTFSERDRINAEAMASFALDTRAKIEEIRARGKKEPVTDKEASACNKADMLARLSFQYYSKRLQKEYTSKFLADRIDSIKEEEKQRIVIQKNDEIAQKNAEAFLCELDECKKKQPPTTNKKRTRNRKSKRKNSVLTKKPALIAPPPEKPSSLISSLEKTKSKFLLNLHKQTSKFSLEKRVKRWMTSDQDKIRAFADKKKGSVVFQYKDLKTDEEFEKQFSNHHLFGIEKVISNERLKNHLTFATDRGLGIVAEKIMANNTIERGIVYLGIDSTSEKTQKIFHLHFESAASLPKKARDLLKDTLETEYESIDTKENADEENSSQWVHPSYEFSLEYMNRVLKISYYDGSKKRHAILLYPKPNTPSLLK